MNHHMKGNLQKSSCAPLFTTLYPQRISLDVSKIKNERKLRNVDTIHGREEG
jgi:hypothetical protein